eukprot:COSAG05_NODE_4640_length_1428_cov_1.679458_2_plen_61_part_01
MPIPYSIYRTIHVQQPYLRYSTGRFGNENGWLYPAFCTRFRCSAQKTDYTIGISWRLTFKV